jgi:hypothetical protein
MNPRQLVVSIVFAAAMSGVAMASGFEVTVRPHADRIQLGDPLYLEFTVVNRGREPVMAPDPSLPAATMSIEAFDPDTQLSMPVADNGGSWEGIEQIRYEPNVPARQFVRVFMPGLRRFDHPFWKPIGIKGQSVLIKGSYRPRRKMLFTSDQIYVHVTPREIKETHALELWSTGEFPGFGQGPIPSDLGLQFKSGLSRQQMADLAEKIPTGEIHDLLLLTVHLRDIYDTPADSRDEKDRQLVAWLQKLPDIKRQCLISEVRSVASHYKLATTTEGVEELIDWK